MSRRRGLQRKPHLTTAAQGDCCTLGRPLAGVAAGLGTQPPPVGFSQHLEPLLPIKSRSQKMNEKPFFLMCTKHRGFLVQSPMLRESHTGHQWPPQGQASPGRAGITGSLLSIAWCLGTCGECRVVSQAPRLLASGDHVVASPPSCSGRAWRGLPGPVVSPMQNRPYYRPSTHREAQHLCPHKKAKPPL